MSLVIPSVAYIPSDVTSLKMAYNSFSISDEQTITKTRKTPYRSNEGAKNEDKEPIWQKELETKEDIKEYIIWSAEMMEVDVNLALDLAKIESQFDPKAKNPFSTAYSIYQITTPTWNEICVCEPNTKRDDVKLHIQCAHRIIYYEGLDRWTISKPTCHRLHELGYVKLSECAYYKK